jgi:DNA-directed RNA polymerase subunit delta
MHDLKEKSAYLRGLVEGTGYFENEKQKLVWDGLMDFCDGVAQNLDELDGSQNDFAEYIEAVDEDLSTLEKYFYSAEEEDEETEILFTKESGEVMMELTCPNCHEEICFEDEPGNYEVVCPECGKVVWNHTVTPVIEVEKRTTS